MSLNDLLAAVTAGSTWKHDAACTGKTDYFYPDANGLYKDLDYALSLCATCPVSDECRQAGHHEEFGIWGGTTGRQRMRERGVTVAPVQTEIW